jgi:hypothetical protein
MQYEKKWSCASFDKFFANKFFFNPELFLFPYLRLEWRDRVFENKVNKKNLN